MERLLSYRIVKKSTGENIAVVNLPQRFKNAIRENDFLVLPPPCLEEVEEVNHNIDIAEDLALSRSSSEDEDDKNGESSSSSSSSEDDEDEDDEGVLERRRETNDQQYQQLTDHEDNDMKMEQRDHDSCTSSSSSLGASCKWEDGSRLEIVNVYSLNETNVNVEVTASESSSTEKNGQRMSKEARSSSESLNSYEIFIEEISSTKGRLRKVKCKLCKKIISRNNFSTHIRNIHEKPTTECGSCHRTVASSSYRNHLKLCRTSVKWKNLEFNEVN